MTQKRPLMQLDRLPTSSPAPITPTAAADQPQYEQEDHRAKKRIDDERNDAGTKVDAYSRQKPIANKGTDKAND